MELIPLQEWTCDECGEIIQDAKNNHVIFIENENTKVKTCFKIVHNSEKCLKKYKSWPSLPISSFTNLEGTASALATIDPGVIISPEYKTTVDMRSFVEICKRTLIPYYEEARNYLKSAASEDGVGNERTLHNPEYLKEIIQRYSEQK